MLLVDQQGTRPRDRQDAGRRTLVESGVLRLDLLSSDRAMSLYERFRTYKIPGLPPLPDESLRPPEADSPS